MKSLTNSLHDHSLAMLRAIAELNGVTLRSNVARQAVEQLSHTLKDPEHLSELLSSSSDQAIAGMNTLLRNHGRMPAPSFERRFGSIRHVGPGRLERESPHRQATSASEELWYRGLVYRAFAQTIHGPAEFLYVPPDLIPLLPAPGDEQTSFRVTPAGMPSQIVRANDHLLHDACTLLCLAQADRVRLTNAGNPMSWRSKSLYEWNRFLLQPVSDPEAICGSGPATPTALLWNLVGDLNWLRADSTRAQLNPGPVRKWLEASRTQQRHMLLQAWQDSSRWNDLCRTPALQCEETGSWANDPVDTRRQLLPLLAGLASNSWYSIEDLILAVQQESPDFQRPDGNYETWYIRRRADGVFLRGYEDWKHVEGELLHFLITGPLHWLGATDLGRDHQDTGSDTHFRLTDDGGKWLARDPSPGQTTEAPIEVLSDYSMVVPDEAPLFVRFQVSRFTTWETSGPPFRFRITQTGLKRAGRQGISADRILAFLTEHTGGFVPENVTIALQRWAS